MKFDNLLLKLIGQLKTSPFFCTVQTTKGVKVRNLMVYSHYTERRFMRGYWVPYIRLRGKWLRDAGFEIGDTIRVTPTKAGLFISNDRNTDK